MEKKPTYQELEAEVSRLENELRDREAVLRAIKDSDKRFREIIEEVSGISIQGYDENRRVTFWNQASEELYGYKQSQAKGRRLEDLIIPEGMKETVKQFHHQWVTQNIKIPPGELVLKDKSGRDVPVYSSHIMLDTPRGREMFCIDVNLAPIKQAEAEKAVLQAQLRQAQKMEALGTLAGGIAHDFNNVLFSIGGMSELLLEDLEPESPARETMVEIISAVQRGSELIKQILSFSRRSEQAKKPVRFQKILEEVIKLCRSAIPANLEMVQEIQADMGYVMADPTRLHQVVMNLITNAFHALNQDKGEIRVTLRQTMISPEDPARFTLKPGPHALLRVSDSGTGIDPDHMEKIFEPYFTTKNKGKGTGLGLATVYNIIREYGGEIKVKSQPGKGATFEVFLPIVEAKADTHAGKKRDRPQTGSERILLVDDEPAITTIEKQMLSRLGYRITTRNHSREALDAFKSNPRDFDLVITDMAMPGLTGAGLARAMLNIRPDIPIIICTGFSDLMDRRQAEEMGVKGFLIKPVEGAKMARTVRHVLDNSGGGRIH